MKGLLPLFLGIFGTFAFSWAGLTYIPSLQIGHLDPQTDEEGNDPYPAPRSGMAERGRQVYAANGCIYCHSQQVRADYAASDVDRKWGTRRSAPRDYIFDRPVLLGKMRVGPDLANIGKRAPVEDENAAAPASIDVKAPAAAPASSAAAPAPSVAATPPPTGTSSAAGPAPANTNPTPGVNPPGPADVATTVNGAPLPYTADWHHRHLYDPRSITEDSNMPSYRFLYLERRITGEPSSDAIKFSGAKALPEGREVVPTYDAKCLVAYLMSLDQSHPLNEVKSASAPATPPAPGKQVK